MQFPKKEVAQLVVTTCVYFKMETVIISPGSRNAPLTVGFTNHPKIEALSVIDERCAAFFALGIAQQTRKLVAVICTSGSALLNYYPAVAEAFYSKIPLVVISADRPKHLIDIGDGQAIRQKNVFANHILCSVNLTENPTDLKENQTLLQTVFQTAIQKKGPVHINVHFDEPLYETTLKMKSFDFKNFYADKNSEIPTVPIQKFVKIWNTAPKKMILIGTHFPDEKLQKIVSQFASDTSVLVFTETTSNLYGQKFINSIDKLIFTLNNKQLTDLQPEILLTFGGMVVSKKIKQFLRKYSPKHHWHIDELTPMDTYHCLSEFVSEKPQLFLERLYKASAKNDSKYQSKWLSVKEKRQVRHQNYLQKTPYSDLKVFESILNSIPKDSQLQLSNSSVIRYSQLFDIDKTLLVFCNRGTSGIDGSTSTAIGAAFSAKKQTIFITGDLSFFYDSNALWNNYIPKNFRIIIINNGGGGIFRFISGPQTTNATDYFETPHNLTAKELSKMYNFAYYPVINLTNLQVVLKDFYELSNQPKILEVFTPRQRNDTVLKDYFKNL